jgi:hypothetical protein
MGKFKKAEAYWITPNNCVFPITDKITAHIDLVVENPKAFGLSDKDVTYKFNKFGDERACEIIISDLINHGWIRIRSHVKSSKMFAIDVNGLTPKVRAVLQSFAVDMLSLGFAGCVFSITDRVGTEDYQIEDVAFGGEKVLQRFCCKGKNIKLKDWL